MYLCCTPLARIGLRTTDLPFGYRGECLQMASHSAAHGLVQLTIKGSASSSGGLIHAASRIQDWCQNTNCWHETCQEESCRRSNVGRLDTETRNDFLTVPTYSPSFSYCIWLKEAKVIPSKFVTKCRGGGMFSITHSISTWFLLLFFFFPPADSPQLKYMTNTCPAVFCRTSLFETMAAVFLLHSVYTHWNINLSA